MTLNVQFLTMLSMIAGGFYVGIVLDTFRRLTKCWKHRFILLSVMEVCFWLLQTFILFYILFLVNGGELRAYVFIACLFGFATYQAVAKKWYQQFLEHMLSMIVAVYRFIAHVNRVLIVLPIKYICRFVLTCLIFCLQIITFIVGFALKIVFLPLVWLLKMMYVLLPQRIQHNIHKLEGFYSTIENIYVRCRKFMTFKRR
ncbi:MAG TPA: spore cortex biosynthesis protein YabQ [Bacillota bacterium]